MLSLSVQHGSGPAFSPEPPQQVLAHSPASKVDLASQQSFSDTDSSGLDPLQQPVAQAPASETDLSSPQQESLQTDLASAAGSSQQADAQSPATTPGLTSQQSSSQIDSTQHASSALLVTWSALQHVSMVLCVRRLTRSATCSPHTFASTIRAG